MATSSYNTRSTRTMTTTQHRHFCVVLTNNPRMIQSARRMLQTAPLQISTEQGREAQQEQPTIQMQSLSVPGQTRSRRRHGAVPMVASLTTATPSPSEMRSYEQEIEEDFQAQIQPTLQLYLQKTRRTHPVNSVFDMSTHIQF